MAYNFNGTNQSISASSAPVASHPMTFFAQMKNSSFSASGQTAISVGGVGGGQPLYVMYAYQPSASDPRYEIYVSGSARAATVTDAAFVTDVWRKVVGVAASTTSRTIYVDATYTATTTTTDNTGSATVFRIGAYDAGGIFGYFAGDLAECAMWSAALTADEAASLAKGFKPYRIRPQSLKFYAPLVRNIADRKGGLALTNNNSATVAAHPRVI